MEQTPGECIGTRWCERHIFNGESLLKCDISQTRFFRRHLCQTVLKLYLPLEGALQQSMVWDGTLSTSRNYMMTATTALCLHIKHQTICWSEQSRWQGYHGLLNHFPFGQVSLCRSSLSAQTEMSSVPSISFLFSLPLCLILKKRDKGRWSRLVRLPTGSIRTLCKNRTRRLKAASSALWGLSGRDREKKRVFYLREDVCFYTPRQ